MLVEAIEFMFFGRRFIRAAFDVTYFCFVFPSFHDNIKNMPPRKAPVADANSEQPAPRRSSRVTSQPAAEPKPKAAPKPKAKRSAEEDGAKTSKKVRICIISLQLLGRLFKFL